MITCTFEEILSCYGRLPPPYSFTLPDETRKNALLHGVDLAPKPTGTRFQLMLPFNLSQTLVCENLEDDTRILDFQFVQGRWTLLTPVTVQH